MFNRDEIVGYTNGVYELCARAECFEGDAGFMAILRKDANGEDHNLVCNSCGEYLLADEIAAEEAYYKAEYMREKALAIEVLENESAQDCWDQLVEEADKRRKE